MKNDMRGFTLVELLAIIVILGVMVILVVPQIGGSINSKKEKELEKIIDIIENAGKAYHISNKDEYMISVDTLVNEKYLSSKLENPVTGEKLDECVKVTKNKEGLLLYEYTSCDYVEVSVTIDLRGGSSTQFLQEITQNTYSVSTKIELVNPTKENFVFSHWEVVKGNSYINNNDNTLIVGDTETIVYAIWESWPTLTLELGKGGTTTQSFETSYKSGTTIKLINPTREGYVFTKWSVNEGVGQSIVSGNNFTMGSIDTVLTAKWKQSFIYSYRCLNISKGVEPYKFVYTGDCEVIDEDENYRVKFLTSGTFTPYVDELIDVFMVGGGGAGGNPSSNNTGGGGGGGGYDNIGREIMLNSNQSYDIVVGSGGSTPSAAGESSSAFGYSANGGAGGAAAGTKGGAGGYGSSSGGTGGNHGNKGTSPDSGVIREFGEETGELYAGGGAGGRGYNPNSTGNSSTIAGGAGGGGSSDTAGVANTGGGGGGGTEKQTTTIKGQPGGSGIVIIRNSRYIIDDDDNSIPQFAYTGRYEVVDDYDNPITMSEKNWKIRFLTSGTLTISKLRGASNGIDVFLVGGGGAGGMYSSSAGGGGGGGGYIMTVKGIDVEGNVEYDIVVGEGGTTSAGKSSSAFGYSVNGGGVGSKGGSEKGGAGGTGSSNGGRGGFSGTKGSLPGDSVTREFNENFGSYYGGGGAGGRGYNSNTQGSSATINGGGGGGGASGRQGIRFTGGGGGGGNASEFSPVKNQYGGSGIVIIRNAR